MPERYEEAHVAALYPGPIDAGLLEQFAPGAIARFVGEIQDIALINDRGTVVALTDLCLRCSHALSQGTLAGGLLTCPNCGWQYDVGRGCVANLPALRVETHAVRIEGGRIRIEPHGGWTAARSP